jgi:3-oxoacyl-[acyl-carrier protein] reductase
MELGLAGKKVLVTGGTKGIGRAVVLGAARQGAEVVTCYRHDQDAADSLVEELKQTPGPHHVLRADLENIEEIDGLLEACGTHLGSLDAVVNNVGVISHVPFRDLAIDEWHRILNSNLTAVYRVVRQALPLLRAGSSVVSVGSGSAFAGIPLRAHYTASKAGLVGLSRSLAKELGPDGIRVNVVSPGVIETESLAAMPSERADEVRAHYTRKTSLGRLGTVDEVANVVLFLISDLASYVDAATFEVNGGI